MPTPYDALPSKAYWSTGVARTASGQMEGLYTPKFEIGPDTRLATAGSCFAQNLRQAIVDRGYSYVDMEPAPPGLSGAAARRYGFSQFSARYGNIYTVRQLLELLEEVDGARPVGGPIWRRDGRFFDALRPAVEPDGLDSAASVLLHREQHVARVRSMIDTADVFVFTLGLTEAWIDNLSGRVVPTAPGVVAGDYDPERYTFVNFGPHEVIADLEAARMRLKARNPALRILLTVSPVPLTATASAGHVFVATSYSKGVLRGAAGWFAQKYDDVDYFPSYDFITNCFNSPGHFEPNLRSVSPGSVASVMKIFFGDAPDAQPSPPPVVREASTEPEEVNCEDALLDAFAR